MFLVRQRSDLCLTSIFSHFQSCSCVLTTWIPTTLHSCSYCSCLSSNPYLWLFLLQLYRTAASVANFSYKPKLVSTRNTNNLSSLPAWATKITLGEQEVLKSLFSLIQKLPPSFATEVIVAIKLPAARTALNNGSDSGNSFTTHQTFSFLGFSGSSAVFIQL